MSRLGDEILSRVASLTDSVLLVLYVKSCCSCCNTVVKRQAKEKVLRICVLGWLKFCKLQDTRGSEIFSKTIQRLLKLSYPCFSQISPSLHMIRPSFWTKCLRRGTLPSTHQHSLIWTRWWVGQLGLFMPVLCSGKLSQMHASSWTNTTREGVTWSLR